MLVTSGEWEGHTLTDFLNGTSWDDANMYDAQSLATNGPFRTECARAMFDFYTVSDPVRFFH